MPFAPFSHLAAAALLSMGVAAQADPTPTPLLPDDAPRAVLLVTSTGLADAWMPFATWKTRCGKPTRIANLDWIAEHYPADTVQESIRACVRDHVDHRGTRWVVLGGDCDATGAPVPGGPTTVHAQEPRGIPTDIVYLSPTNWDADGDGILGEWPDDAAAITYPDGSVGLGRVPVRTATDVAAFTEKVIEYESAYPEDGFAGRMVYTCTDAPAYPKVRRSWDEHVSAAWPGTVERFFAAETPWDGDAPGSHALSPENLSALIDEKRVGKLHVHGHGMLPFWVLESGNFTADHVGRLSNRGAYPLITTVSCFTGQYDGAEDPSIVEAMLRRPGAGSVAIVAPIRTGKPHFHDRSDFRLMVSEGKLDGTTQTMTRYWVHGLGEERLTTGEALMRAKADMRADAEKSAGFHLCICELNLLGDPTLDMRPETPRRPEVRAEIAPLFAARALVVTTDAPGAEVCIWRKDELYATLTADDAGRASLPLPRDTARLVRVGVSGPRLDAVTEDVPVPALSLVERMQLNAQRAELQMARVNLRALDDARTIYHLKHRKAAGSLQALVDDEVLEELPSDPWGHAFRLDAAAGRFGEVFSVGPDGEPGTTDDVRLERPAQRR